LPGGLNSTWRFSYNTVTTKVLAPVPPSSSVSVTFTV
jgi:hypothetical protein